MRLTWDGPGERIYETGVDHGVLYQVNEASEYVDGVEWNGLTGVTASPSGAESNKQYADNIEYLNLLSAEQFGGTITAFTYPPEFGQNDGSGSPTPGVKVGQQRRRMFGFSYRTLKGNDIEGSDYGYIIHLVYGAQAAPSEKAHTTVNDSPELVEFSWEVSTTPVAVGTIGGVTYKPTSTIDVDSTLVDPDLLAELEDILYGTASTEPSMPLPGAVIAMLTNATVLATPAQPSFNAGTNTITIPTVTGVRYTVDGETVAAGPVVISEDTVVVAYPADGYHFPDVTDNDWLYEYTAP